MTNSVDLPAREGRGRLDGVDTDTPQTTPDAAPIQGPSHLPNGKFAPGNKMSRGNPFTKRQALYRIEFAKAITPLQMQAFAQRMYELAMLGEMQAARIVCDYLLGKPKPLDDTKSDDAAKPSVIAPPLPLNATG